MWRTLSRRWRGGLHEQGQPLPARLRFFELRPIPHRYTPCSLGPDLKIMTIAPSLEATKDFARIRYGRSKAPADTPVWQKGQLTRFMPLHRRRLVQRNVRPALGHDRKCTLAHIAGALQAISDAAGAARARTGQGASLRSSARFAPETHRPPTCCQGPTRARTREGRT